MPTWTVFAGLVTTIIVTGFGKMCIVHTYDFSHLEIHNNHREWHTDLKLSRVVKE